MRRLPIILMLVAGAAWAQTTAANDAAIADIADAGSLLGGISSVQDLDLTDASIHQAGPDSFYVRSVGINGADYSLTFAQDSNGIWTLTALNPEDENILPSRTVLDFATLTAVDGSTVRIDGVFVGGSAYSGTLAVGEDADLSLASAIAAGNVDAVTQARARALAELGAAGTETTFEDQLEKQRQELQAIIDQVEAQRDSYKAEVDTLEDERDALAAERDDLADELASLTATPTTNSPVTDAQVSALLKERDELAGQLVGLAMENNQLREDKKTLAEQIQELQTENSRLQTELTQMTAEVRRLTDLVAAYRSANGGETPPAGAAAEENGIAPETATATAEAETAAAAETGAAEETSTAAGVTAPVWTMPGDYLRKSDLEEAAAALTAELKSLENRVSRLEEAATGLAGLEEALRSGATAGTATAAAPASAAPATTAPATTAPEGDVSDVEAARTSAESAATVAQLTAQLADLVRENEDLQRQTRELQNRILEDILSNGLVAIMSERLTRTVHSGFGGSTPDAGDWSVSASRALQADSDAYFAKLAVPAAQGNAPVLYSFRVRSLDPEGWVGVGLHFFVSDVEKRRGYGMGRSLLVWLTRDPDVYKTQLTYLQLYRSDDDINMGRVLDSVIQEPISDFLDVAVLYEPETQYLTIAIDGEDKVRYRTWFGIDSGVEVALRSLGAAEFRDLRISTEPTETARATRFRAYR